MMMMMLIAMMCIRVICIILSHRQRRWNYLRRLHRIIIRLQTLKLAIVDVRVVVVVKLLELRLHISNELVVIHLLHCVIIILRTAITVPELLHELVFELLRFLDLQFHSFA